MNDHSGKESTGFDSQDKLNLSAAIDRGNKKRELNQILIDMQALRLQTMISGAPSTAQQDQYLAFSTELASALLQLDSNEIVSDIKDIRLRIARKPKLEGYDPRQDSYWNIKEPEFVSRLERILILIQKENFQDLDQKYHILQAIKHYEISDATLQRKEYMYNTIMPLTSVDVPDQAPGKEQGIIDRILGRDYRIEEVAEGKAKVNKTPADLEGLLGRCRKLGYDSVTVTLPEEAAKAILEKVKGTKAAGSKKALDDSTEYLSAIGDMIRKVPLHDALIGSLPKYIRDRLNETATETQSEDKQAVESIYIGDGVPLAACILGGIFSSGWLFLPAVYFIAEGLTRMVQAGDNDNLIGTGPAKIIMSPLEVYLRYTDGKKATFTDVEFDIRTKDTKLESPLQYFNSIASASIPADYESSLVWSTSNHYGFGEAFTAYIIDKFGEFKDANMTIDKKHNAVVFDQATTVGSYSKTHSLFCYQGVRYLLTAISEQKALSTHEKKSSVGTMAAMLEDRTSLRQKALNLKNIIEPVYMKLTKFENGTMSEEQEVA